MAEETCVQQYYGNITDILWKTLLLGMWGVGGNTIAEVLRKHCGNIVFLECGVAGDEPEGPGKTRLSGECVGDTQGARGEGTIFQQLLNIFNMF